MNRRKAMKIAAGIFAGSGFSLLFLSSAFKIKKPAVEIPRKLEFQHEENDIKYSPLNPDFTAELAYNAYNNGGCMYATISSIVSQLSEKYGEPYKSIPIHMFKYGHGGVGGYGTLCGTLNGAAALAGLLITNKNARDNMIADIFQWYEKTSFPEFKPDKPVFDFTPTATVSNSVLCHASNTNWCNKSGFKIDSDERKERCRRLAGDVAKKLTIALNEVFANTYMTNTYSDIEKNTCLTCHGNEGKVNNTTVGMNCKSCHSKSVGHKVFSDIHYKLMSE